MKAAFSTVPFGWVEIHKAPRHSWLTAHEGKNQVKTADKVYFVDHTQGATNQPPRRVFIGRSPHAQSLTLMVNEDDFSKNKAIAPDSFRSVLSGARFEPSNSTQAKEPLAWLDRVREGWLELLQTADVIPGYDKKDRLRYITMYSTR